MKKLISLFALIFTLSLIFADEPTPFVREMKTGDTIALKGRFALWNGWPPNMRFITDGNKVIGIGKGEDYYHETVTKIALDNLQGAAIHTSNADFEYIGNVRLPYYDEPLMCFAVLRISEVK